MGVLTLAASLGIACGDAAPSGHLPAPSKADAAVDGSVPLCVDGKPTVTYPPPPYEMAILGTVPPGTTFDGVDDAVNVGDFFEPCATRSRILIVRSSAAWCGPCQWDAAHTKHFMAEPSLAGRLVLLDLLVADEDNVPAKRASLSSWRAKFDMTDKFAIDPAYTFGPALISRAPLPAYVFIDTRTMTILSTMSDPDTASLQTRLAIELADLDGTPRPAPHDGALFDERFNDKEMALLRGMRLDGASPPPDPTNEVGDVPAAVSFGKALFFDALLSPSGAVSCATCHDPQRTLTDGVPQSTGVAKVDRNAPSVALAAYSRWQFWDGRADTLWMQALGPFEDSKEFGSSRLYVAHRIADRYFTQYEAVFGAKYPLPDLAKLPAQGKPGDSAYDELDPSEKESVTRVFVNVGKAIAAFERAIRVKPNALDRYADGQLDALSAAEKDALSLFLKNGCVQCHWGPRLTDDAFHVLRFPTGRQDGVADRGRETGLSRLAASEFLASSNWSDAPSAAKLFDVNDRSSMVGAFKTPTLRGLLTSAPYGHGGTLATLLDVAHHYGTRGLDNDDPRAIGTTEPWVPNFDVHIHQTLPVILDVMTGEVELP